MTQQARLLLRVKQCNRPYLHLHPALHPSPPHTILYSKHSLFRILNKIPFCSRYYERLQRSDAELILRDISWFSESGSKFWTNHLAVNINRKRWQILGKNLMFLRRKFDTDFDCVICLFEHNEKFKFQTHLFPATLDWLFAARSLAVWTFPCQTEKKTAIIL